MVRHNLLKSFAVSLTENIYEKPDVAIIIFSLFIKVTLNGEGHFEICLSANCYLILICEIRLYSLFAHYWIVSTCEMCELQRCVGQKDYENHIRHNTSGNCIDFLLAAEIERGYSFAKHVRANEVVLWCPPTFIWVTRK